MPPVLEIGYIDDQRLRTFPLAFSPFAKMKSDGK